MHAVETPTASSENRASGAWHLQAGGDAVAWKEKRVEDLLAAASANADVF